MDVGSAALGGDLVGDGFAEVFLDAPSDVFLSLHDTWSEILVRFDVDVVGTALKKIRECCRGVMLGGLPFLYLDWALLIANFRFARLFSIYGLAFQRCSLI